MYNQLKTSLKIGFLKYSLSGAEIRFVFLELVWCSDFVASVKSSDQERINDELHLSFV